MNIKLFLCTALAVVLLLTLAACGVPSSSSAPSPEAPGLPTIASYVAIPKSESSPPSSASEAELAFDAPERWQEPLPIGLIRGWYGDVSVGAGFAERYLFLDDGTFYFVKSQYAGWERLCYMDGEWSYAENTVRLIVKRKVVIEGGELIPAEETTAPQADTIEGGTHVRIELPEGEYEILDLPLKIIPTDEELEDYYGIPGSIMLGDLQLYVKDGVGFEELPTRWDYYGSL